uniref:Uncharacterized protein n=1 Tax=Avena sativa TaxID=4498 RepID=A0ACD5WIR2_AVESA
MDAATTTSPSEVPSPSSLLRCSGSIDQGLGQSMRVYSSATGKVPFEWEKEPGKPKSLLRVDTLPLLCPSPAMESARLIGRDNRRGGTYKRRLDPSSEPDGFEGCLPVKFRVGRAMRRWDIVCFFRGEW